MDKFRSYFTWSGKTITYIYLGVDYPIARLQTGLRVDTVTKMCEGLNHFLYYYYLKHNGEYEELAANLFEYYLNTKNRFQKAREVIDNNSFYTMMKAIEEVGKLNHYMIEKAAEYTYNIQVPNINEAKATTDVTLTNHTALLLAGISVLMKLCFLYVNNAYIKIKWIDTISLYDDYLVNELTDELCKYDDEIPKNVQDEVLAFLYDRVANLWSVSPESYREKFTSIGLDVASYGSKNKVDIYNALKKYVPQIITYDIGREVYECRTDKELRELYWTEGKNFDDFKFVAQNMAAYIQKTLGDINAMQDQNKGITDVNVAEVLIETAGEDTSRREESLYEDKHKHLYNLRKETCIDVFDIFVKEINTYFPNNYNVIKDIVIDESNSFNQYILGICLLSMTGECFVYRDVLGVYAKVILALFYLRAKSDPTLEPIYDKLEIMKSEKQSRNTHYPEDKIIEHLTKIKRTDLISKVGTIAEICTTYHGKSGMIDLSPGLFIEILDLFKNPSRVRHLLFPNRYDILETEANVSDNKHNDYVYETLDRVKTKVGFDD